MRNATNIICGTLLIVLGLILGLNALDITDINVFFDGWWTLFIIVPCFVGVWKEKEKTGNIIGLIIGIFLLLCCQDVMDFDIIWKLLFPTILVGVGVSFLVKNMAFPNFSKEKKKEKLQEEKEYCAVFGEQKLDFTNEIFTGCKIDAIFGGATCDLRDSLIEDDVWIKASAIFGGIDIYVPRDVNVKVSSTSIFGGVSNKTKNNKVSDCVTIYIEATAMFGGVEIK